MLETIAEVLINRPSKHLNRTFSYRIPESLKEAGPGWRCVVSFARRKEEGIILSVHEEDTAKLDYKILPIDSLVDSFPWFTEEMMRTALWISNYYMCTLIEALRLFYIDKKAIKTAISYRIDWKAIDHGGDEDIPSLVDRSVEEVDEKDGKLLFGDRLPLYVQKGFLVKKEVLDTIHKEPLEKWLVPDRPLSGEERKKSRRQAALSDFLQTSGPCSFEDLKEEGFGTSLLKSFCLNDHGHIIYRRKKTFSLIEEGGGRDSRQLTDEQKQAVDTINASIDRSRYEGFLLQGVTGSGKTEVYLQTARHALGAGGSALILVPEIALTNQMTSYFASVFGDKVVFIHSNLSKGERYNNRMRISNGESSIIIGSRSAIFMPFRNLRLIVVDEEYDSSYKQGESPRYNGRDVAKVMALTYHCPIVLGAATPSIATRYAADEGKIRKISMNHRVFQTPLPKIHVCDLRETPPIDENGLISGPLVSLLQQTIARRQKAILLLNRRGFATTLMCPSCGYVFKCPNCDVSLVYHKETHQLKCHYCETVHPVPTECPKCHSHRRRHGTGGRRTGRAAATGQNPPVRPGQHPKEKQCPGNPRRFSEREIRYPLRHPDGGQGPRHPRRPDRGHPFRRQHPEHTLLPGSGADIQPHHPVRRPGRTKPGAGGSGPPDLQPLPLRHRSGGEAGLRVLLPAGTAVPENAGISSILQAHENHLLQRKRKIRPGPGRPDLRMAYLHHPKPPRTGKDHSPLQRTHQTGEKPLLLLPPYKRR